jgi:NADH-quinone oxidoreductase subunit L
MFDDPKHYLWLIPFLPFLGAAVIALLGKPLLRGLSHWPCILGAAGACVLSVMALLKVHQGETTLVDNRIWFEAGNVQVAFALRLDALAAVMLVTVTFIGTLIAIYSSGYMHGDPGYPRFFAAVSLFLASMTGLVLASNLILLYACWEGVGLCSYLLIGFWYARPSAAAAARKAFLVTRLGDIGLFLGILILWNTYHTLNFYTDSANPDAPGLFSLVNASDPLLGWACLLLFIGAVGKSAQFPLHVWLPDAMEGPSPVSALIHAATMVTAGVYLVARCTPLFQLVPDVQAYIACTGGFTALLAALIALTQTDLKRVLAYSTVSQLGFMFLALGAALQTSDPERTLAPLAVTAAIFHLFTHAFFKALLFLGAGSVMHAMGDVIDMRKFSGLRRVLPTTHWTFLIGSLALAGVVPLAGFWSKDEILAVVRSACDERFPYRHLYSVLFLGAIITAGMTAFYTFRAYFMTFWGVEKIPQEAYMHHGHGHDEHAHGHDHGHHHGHSHGPESGHGSGAHDPAKKHFESGEIMLWPLRILAAGAVLVGVVLGPTGLFAHFLEDHWMKAPEGILPAGTKLIHAHNYPVMIGSTLFALGGIALAYFAYVKRPSLAQDFQNSAKRMYYWSLNKFYLDELFSFLFVQPCLWLAKAARVIDQYVVDGLVDLVGQLPAYLATLTRPVQNGLVQFYALLMALGIAGFLLAVLLR